jgi:hypothetical protein
MKGLARLDALQPSKPAGKYEMALTLPTISVI